MNRQYRWSRVKPNSPCVICGRPDWCGYAEDAGLVVCMRVESSWPTRNGGWLHKTGDGNMIPVYDPPVTKAIPEPVPDFEAMWKEWLADTDHYMVDGLAMELGVDTDALERIGAAWNGHAWAFPMHDAEGNIIGIRLRNEEGKKWSVKGSRSGLIYCREESPERTLWVCEGPTDTAAALTLGLSAVGRASCLGQYDLLRDYIRAHRVQRVAIVADNDKPDKNGRRAGRRGAEQLQNELRVWSCVWSPPVKDLREFVRLGGSRDTLNAMTRDLVWHRPEMRAA